jgi:predicted O-methyltransferase YrrM
VLLLTWHIFLMRPQNFLLHSPMLSAEGLRARSQGAADTALHRARRLLRLSARCGRPSIPFMMERAKSPNEVRVPMNQDQWTAVDSYITDKLVIPDAALEAALKANAAAELPSIDVAPNQGKMLHVLALAKGARRILEIGTLGGYSTIWLARALPAGGRLITLEVEPKHAAVAQGNLDRAGLSGMVEIRVGPAVDSLARLCKEDAAPFDLIFIDADKQSISNYLGWSLKLAKRGTLIVTDNVVREGAILDPESTDPNVQGARAMFTMMAAEPRLSATVIQTVGSKGYDGFALAVVVSD